MLNLSQKVKMLSVVICLGMTTSVFAQSAPVYDADNNMQEDSAGIDQTQYYSPPPPPEQEVSGGSTFVPMQTQPAQPQAVPQEQSTFSAKPAHRKEQQTAVQTSESVARIDSLQEQMQALRGQVEQLSRQLEQLQNQQKSLLLDIDNRLSKAETNNSVVATKPIKKSVEVSEEPKSIAKSTSEEPTKPVAKLANASEKSEDASWATSPIIKTTKQTTAKAMNTASASADAHQPNVAEEQQIYQTAYNFIKEKKYNDAVNALQGMLKRYPSGQFASNAHYWLGELYGLMGKNAEALTEFGAVVHSYPESPRVSDAQLKLGLIFASQLKWAEAKTALKKVINHYPGSASARLASDQLKQIKQAGH
jgi:tol-pal system protein YbgF